MKASSRISRAVSMFIEKTMNESRKARKLSRLKPGPR